MVDDAENPGPADIVEEIIDALMFGDLVSGYPSARIDRSAPGEIIVDLGLPHTFVVTVTERLAQAPQ